MKRILGLRSLKTILAVFIIYIIATIFPELNPAMMAAAAITAINSSIFDSLRSSFDRVMANIVAIMVAFMLQSIKQVNPFGVTIGMTIIIVACYFFNWQYTIGSALIFFVFVLDVPYANKNLEIYALNRIIDTIIGSVLGLLVNTYVLRPRQEKVLLNSYRSSYLGLRSALKNLLENDISVDEVKLIDELAQINYISKKLRKDIRLKMNENINTVTVSKLNNLFRSALSLIIELNDLDEKPIITANTYEELFFYFKGDLNTSYIIGEIENNFDRRYNFELRKLVHTLNSIEYNLYEFTKMYNEQENKWYLERK